METDCTRPKFSIRKAHKVQSDLAKSIVFEDKLQDTRLIAGIDIAYTKELSIGAVAVLEYDSLELVELQTAVTRTRFPYVPTLLSFRELPPAVQSVRKLRSQPSIFLVDGQGFAHPYGCGFASHLGLVIQKPTIGVAKSRLCGKIGEAREGMAFLYYQNRIVGAAVTTKKNQNPVYVSVGHMVSLETAIRIVKHCTVRSRVPEPILRAHAIAAAEKRKINMT